MSDSYIIYTDGSCYPNPGPGGWAFVVLDGNLKLLKKDSGYNHKTTNNRMELEAILHGLSSISQPSNITVYTDSELVTKYNSKGLGKKNRDLIQELVAFNAVHNIKYIWIKGHNGNKWNEFVDHLAGNARLKQA